MRAPQAPAPRLRPSLPGPQPRAPAGAGRRQLFKAAPPAGAP